MRKKTSGITGKNAKYVFLMWRKEQICSEGWTVLELVVGDEVSMSPPVQWIIFVKCFLIAPA